MDEMARLQKEQYKEHLVTTTAFSKHDEEKKKDLADKYVDDDEDEDYDDDYYDDYEDGDDVDRWLKDNVNVDSKKIYDSTKDLTKEKGEKLC
jgi:hypothetical protein